MQPDNCMGYLNLNRVAHRLSFIAPAQSRLSGSINVVSAGEKIADDKSH
jgi:hypothetical protein